jgi:hypothetical protein
VTVSEGMLSNSSADEMISDSSLSPVFLSHPGFLPSYPAGINTVNGISKFFISGSAFVMTLLKASSKVTIE